MGYSPKCAPESAPPCYKKMLAPLPLSTKTQLKGRLCSRFGLTPVILTSGVQVMGRGSPNTTTGDVICPLSCCDFESNKTNIYIYIYIIYIYILLGEPFLVGGCGQINQGSVNPGYDSRSNHALPCLLRCSCGLPAIHCVLSSDNALRGSDRLMETSKARQNTKKKTCDS